MKKLKLFYNKLIPELYEYLITFSAMILAAGYGKRLRPITEQDSKTIN